MSRTFPAATSCRGESRSPGDGNPSNDRFVVEEPLILEARSGEPHDIGVTITSVTPAQIAPGSPLTYTYTLLNLTGYTGPVTVTFQLSSSTSGRVLLTEEVMLDGAERQIVREVATTGTLAPGSYRPVMRVQIENDTNPANNTSVFADSVVVGAAPSLTSLGPAGDPPPAGDLAETNLSEWELEAYRGRLPVNPGVRLGSGAAPVAGASFLTAEARWADRLVLRYPRPAALKVNWDLSSHSALEFWMSLGPNARLSSLRPRITLRSANGGRVLTRAEPMRPGSSLFERLSIPLAGGESWTAANEGAFDILRVTEIELDFPARRTRRDHPEPRRSPAQQIDALFFSEPHAQACGRPERPPLKGGAYYACQAPWHRQQRPRTRTHPTAPAGQDCARHPGR